MMTLLAGQQITGSSPGWVPLHICFVTPVCLCHQAVKFGTGQGGDLFG